jgi:hypothetical protein
MEPNQGKKVGVPFQELTLGQKLFDREHLMNWSIIVVENLITGP